ncbi:phosphoribosyltransferase [Chitinimonas lacunae]|uniref:Phosphoribosyltransferase n=1 Tax=Chitinimonas lacunae TaxID=1963018 RepID=A0ABV8MM24_9NEIS
MKSIPLFIDRRDAGRRLAIALRRHAAYRPLVLALPRGGVPVGYEVAQALQAPLDLLLVRKIGYPGQPEVALGAVIDLPEPQCLINESTDTAILPPDYLEQTRQRELEEIRRRRQRYGATQLPDLTDRTVIVVDDGIATGATMRAALLGLSKAKLRSLVVAVPVAAESALELLPDIVDEVVCLAMPDPFYAVGPHYANFAQTSDAEVIELLEKARVQQV